MIEKIGVVGAGVMGHGIAEVFALGGYEVILSDVDKEILSEALKKIRWSIEGLEKKGVVKGKPDEVISRIKTTTNMDAFSTVDFVIEAVKENSQIKSTVLQKLNSVAGENCIFASNTSTIPISELAKMAGRPDRFIGVHFSNPPVIMPIIEIIMGDHTSESTLGTVRKLVKSVGKESVIVRKDVPGFLINRLNDRIIQEALKMLEEGVTQEDLDAMVKFRLGFPMGVCELLDFVGIDTVYYANVEMSGRGFETESSAILKEKVEAGKLGMKTGEGFYKYPKPNVYRKPTIIPNEGMYVVDPVRLLAPAINEAAWIVRNGVATESDVEKAMKMAMNWPDGPLTIADRFGIDTIVSTLKRRQSETGKERYMPDALLSEMVEKNQLGTHTGKGFLEWDTIKKRFGAVDYVKTDSYALLTIDRPESLNALNEAAWEGIRLALEEALKDDTVRSVVVTGNGKAFSAGDDISMMKGWHGSTDAKMWMDRYAQPLLDLIASYEKPIVSAINGIAFGGGCEINMLFDVVIASDKALFSLPEGLIGAMPPVGSSYGVAFVSRKFARYALTGEWISAAEAMRLGMVDIVVPSEQLTVVIAEITGKIARLAPLSVKGIKASVNAVKQTYSTHARLAGSELLILASTEDFINGQAAFLAKKKPEWKGR